MRWSLCIAVCALWGYAAAAPAQDKAPASASSAPVALVHNTAEAELHKTKLALEQARFDEVARLANQLLSADDLPARVRNEARELLAIAQIAARKEREAMETLRGLYRRDPAYARQVQDPGPTVDAVFARARQSTTDTIEVPLRYVVETDAHKRLRLAVDLPAQRDAVDTVHVTIDEPAGVPLAHMVGDVVDARPLSFVLPPAGPTTRSLQLQIEARAPSGAVLGRLREVQVRVPAVPPPPPCPQPKPLRREWWLWTTIGLVVSGFAVASAVAAN